MKATLTQRELNRATLARQQLLERADDVSPLELVTKLAGLQAQTTHSWYIGFWSRLNNFDPEIVSNMMTERRLVRIAAMRSTIHLLTAEDCLQWRPLMQAAIERSTKGSWGKRWAGLDIDQVVETSRKIAEEEPLTFDALGKALAERWGDYDAPALAQIARAYLPLVQVPPRGLWGKSGAAKHTTTEVWLKRKLAEQPSLDEMVLRYLAAFGPASVRDVQAWCGLTKLNEVVERLAPELQLFEAEDGRTLYDLPHAPRPGADVPAPARLLYDYDNLLLSHADRTRFVPADRRDGAFGFELVMGTALVDGMIVGVWGTAKAKDEVVLTIKAVTKLRKKDRAALAQEAADLLLFMHPTIAKHEIRFTAASN